MWMIRMGMRWSLFVGLGWSEGELGLGHLSQLGLLGHLSQLGQGGYVVPISGLF
jgi:hypothetical protein